MRRARLCDCPVIRVVPILAALVFIAACSGESDERPGSTAGEFAFTVNRAGWNEIWLMAADGSERRRLTEVEPPQSDAAGSMSPAWSPDGTQIAFAAQIGTLAEDPRRTEISVMRADGTGERRLTRNEAFDGSPSWSPDGKRIAFTRIAQPGTRAARSGIYVVDADGGHEVRVTQAAWPRFDFGAAWSPDGAEIAFTRATPSAGSGNPRATLHAVALDGGSVRRLTVDGAEPAWSPDGKRIAFVSFRDGYGRTCFHDCSTSGEIYLLEVETGDARRLTVSEADDRSPEWSPDGREIAFVSDRSNRGGHANEIYVMSASGEDVRRITQNAVWDLEPAWRP